MTILELASKTKNNILNQSNGAGSNIKYFHKETNSTIETRGLVSHEDYKEIIENREVISDGITFYSVVLEIKPKKLDKIEVDGDVFTVERFRPDGLGAYDIFCFKDRFHTANSDYNKRKRRF